MQRSRTLLHCPVLGDSYSFEIYCRENEAKNNFLYKVFNQPAIDILAGSKR